ncbi:MAG: AmmeMemoRadiSam system protein B [Spirochaetales bacterium]|nr:AmmeMemoRadiSam system protein B [Spirochaetales bacterium]
MNSIFRILILILCFYSCSSPRREMPIYVKPPSYEQWQSWIASSGDDAANALFPNSLDCPENNTKCQDGLIQGGIASHHQLIAPLLLHYYRELSGIKPEIATFFIIGPDHFHETRAGVAVNTEDYIWGRKRVGINKKAANELIEFLSIIYDPYPFKREHSVLCHIPFIASFFPSADIVPVIIDHDLALSLCRKVSTFIRNYMKNNPGCFVLLSMDFSHHLSAGETRKRDTAAISILMEMNPEFTREITCDSPRSWYIFTTLFSGNPVCMDIRYYTTNERFLRQPVSDITSYFFSFLRTF